MLVTDKRTPVIRFGKFEVDLHAGEVRRSGSKIKLQEQPFQILAMLLERPGQVVSREELQKRLWPADTFVDFDHSLNAAIRRLRDALGDSAENPVFVETVARRGYRFLAPLNGGNESTPSAVLPSGSHSRQSRILISAVILAAGVVIGLTIARSPRQPNASKSPRVAIRRLTANPEDDPVLAGTISPDGKYLAFADKTGSYLREVDSGETHVLKLPSGFVALPVAWYPDGIHLLATRVEGPKAPPSLWQISIMGGLPRKLIDDGRQPAVSRQDSQIAFVRGMDLNEEIWVMDSDGEHPRRIAVGRRSMFGTPAWSPDGRRIACITGVYAPEIFELRTKIDIFDVQAGRQETLLSAEDTQTHTPPQQRSLGTNAGDGSDATEHSFSVGRGFVLDSSVHLGPGLVWTPENQLIYSVSEPRPNQADSNVWSIALDQRGHAAGTAVRITASPDEVANLSATADGKRIAVTKNSINPDVYVVELQGKGTRLGASTRLTLDNRRDFPFSWTPDGKAVLFSSDRDGVYHIFKQQIDQTVPELFVGGPEQAMAPRLTPDNSTMVYVIWPKLGDSPHGRLMRVPLSGGVPQTLLEKAGVGNVQCARLPSTLCLFDARTPTELSFFRFDPFTGKVEELPEAKIQDAPAYAYNWSLSPKGDILATAKAKGVEKDPKITFLFLKTGVKRTVTAEAWARIDSIDFAADGRSLWAPAYVNTGKSALLNIDLEGHTRTMLEDTSMTIGWAIPAPDGKHLALWKARGTSNIWMLER